MAVTREHIGQRVTDGERSGELRDIIRDWSDPARPAWDRWPVNMAFVWDPRNGVEWMALPGDLDPEGVSGAAPSQAR